MRRPSAGLQSLVVDGLGCGRFRLLQVHFSLAPGKEPERPADAYVRGDDLVASYEQFGGRTFKPQVYWRATESAPDCLMSIDLLIAVETALWDTTPAVYTISELPVLECLRLGSADSTRYEPIAMEHDSVVTAGSEGMPLFLARPAGFEWSYVEMMHPADFVSAAFLVSGVPKGFVQLRFPFVCRELEKGVIRKARIRGAVIPRHDDEAVAARLFREFLSSPLPLTR